MSEDIEQLMNLNDELAEKDKEIERLKIELQDTKEHLGEYLHEQEEENKRLNNVINKALHKLRASKDHFKTERENNTITFTIRILEGDGKE